MGLWTLMSQELNNMADIRQAFEYAAQNPTSDFAKNLEQLARSGALDVEAQKNGIDLTPFKPQPIEQPKSTLQKVGGVAKSVIGGIASGVGGAALTAEDYLGRKIVNAVGTEQMKQNLANAPKLQDQLKQQFGGNENPTAFGVGQLGGEIASLAAPVGAVGKATQSTAKALGAKPIVSKLAQAGAEGLAFTAGQSVTEGEKQSLKDYAINAGLNMVFPAAGAVAKKVGENAPARIINSLIKPLQKDFAYGKNPGKTVAELGITANNFDDLISNIKTAKSSVGENIGTLTQKALPQLQSQMDLNTYLSPIDESLAIANKSPRTNANVIQRLDAVKADLVDNINQGIDPQSFKGLVGDLTRWTGNASDDAIVNKSLKQVYGKTSDGMDTVLKGTLTPEEFNAYKKASEQYGNLISAENAATYRDNIVKRADLVSFGAKNSALIAALGTAVASGGGGITTILAGLGGAAVDKAMATPAFKTRLASLLSKLAPKEVQTFFDKVPTAKTLYKQEQLDNLLNQAKKNLKNPTNSQGGFLNVASKSDDLIQEAKKYKSAEEFVKAQGTTVYRGQDSAKFTIEGKSAGIGKSFTIDKKIAEVYGNKKNIIDGVVDNKDILRYNELDIKTKKYIKSIIDERIDRVKIELENGNIKPFEELVLELGEIARIKNKKAIDINSFGIPSESEIRILSEDAIKTKSQLEEIWKKANK